MNTAQRDEPIRHVELSALDRIREILKKEEESKKYENDRNEAMGIDPNTSLYTLSRVIPKLEPSDAISALLELLESSYAKSSDIRRMNIYLRDDLNNKLLLIYRAIGELWERIDFDSPPTYEEEKLSTTGPEVVIIDEDFEARR